VATIVHVTDGSPRDLYDAHKLGLTGRTEYAHVRRQELAAALALAGIGPEQTRELGCVDQEASLHLIDLTQSLTALLRDVKPDVVLTHPYEGGHPDHDATAFIVHAACRLQENQEAAAPVILEMTSYHNSHSGIEVDTFLPGTGGAEVTCVLTDAEREFKQRLLDCYPTQRETLSYFPIGIERFRLAPRYDFTQRPHAGMLFYEGFPWGMTGERFTGLASEALTSLGLTGPL
jgi:LmbE family N-acetylglucosaminyl deacetylase